MNLMHALRGFFNWLGSLVKDGDWERDQYLSQASDLSDLEYRMKKWNQITQHSNQLGLDIKWRRQRCY